MADDASPFDKFNPDSPHYQGASHGIAEVNPDLRERVATERRLSEIDERKAADAAYEADMAAHFRKKQARDEAPVQTAAPDAGPAPSAFDKFNPDSPHYQGADAAPAAPQTSATGAFASHAALGAVPAAAGLVGAGLGAAAVGGAVGALGGPFAPITVPVFGFLGGVAGALATSYGASKAQNYAIKALPAAYKDPLESTLAQQEKEHGTASFLGGLLPVGLTLSPAVAGRAVAANATSFEKLMANPLAERLFAGGIVGGQQLGMEATSPDPTNWANVGYATAFGFLLPRPNRIGELLIGTGTRAAEMAGMRAGAAPAPKAEPAPTVAEAMDSDVFSPEPVFMGSQDPNPTLERSAADARSVEIAATEPPPEPDLHALARRLDPDTFAQRDALTTQREELRRQINDLANPPDEQIAALEDRKRNLESLLPSELGFQNGKEARRLRAEIQDVDRQAQALRDRQAAYAKGEAQETPQQADLRLTLRAVDEQLRDTGRAVASAYRSAADRAGTEVIEPEVPAEAPVAAAEGGPEIVGVPPEPAAPAPKTIVDDLRGKLMDAGRPPEEADAAAQIESAYYSTLAKDFGTTPEDLYAREAADIARNPRRKGGGEFSYTDAQRTITLFRDADSSTIIHEKGHEYLERMFRFAARDDAPAEFKARAQRALDWMGLKSAADLDPTLTGKAKTASTKAQEKFARAFEQYMREGVAPSRELASVFNRFQQWLTKVYQTIKGLGAPINDDIKGVFDRMLTSEPQRTVIAPEQPTLPKTLADLHELDRHATEPADAHIAADRIATETTRAVAELPEDILDEIEAYFTRQNPEPAGEAASGEGQGEPVGAGGAEPDAVAGGEAGGGERSPVVGQRERPVSESGGLSASERGAGGNGPAAKSGAPVAAPSFPEARPSTVDELGNIRLENLTDEQSLREAMRAAVEMNPDDVNPGRTTMGELDRAADVLDLDIDENKLNEIAGSVEKGRIALRAFKKAAIEQSAVLREAGNRFSESGAVEDAAEVAKESERLRMMLAFVSKTQAEFARGTGMSNRSLTDWAEAKRMGRLAEAVQESSGRSLYQLRQVTRMMKMYDSPAKINKLMKDAQQRNFGRMILEYWINGLISGPATHTTYTVGNMLLAFHEATLETGAAAAIGAVRSAFGRQGERVYFGEVGAKLSGAAGGQAKALQAAGEALSSGMTTLLPGEVGRPTSPFQGDVDINVARQMTNDPVTWNELGGNLYSTARGLRDGLMSIAALVKAGGVSGAPMFSTRYSPLGQIPDFEVRGMNVLPLGSILRAPGRAIAGIHSYFRATNYSMEVNSQAFRIATDEALARGDSPSGHQFEARIAELRQNPTDAMMERAHEAANAKTLMGHGGAFVKKISELTNVNFNVPGLGPTPLLKFIDPFVHIASNVIDQSLIQRTPLGILAPEIRASLMGKNGNVAQDMAMARMLVGSGLAITFGGLAAEGYATGSAPEKAGERTMWQMAGYQAHSLLVGDMWYSANRLGALGMLMGVSADLYKVAHLAHEGEFLSAAASLQHAFAQNVLDESFMRGPAELIQAIEDPGRYGERYVSGLLSSFTPFSVGSSQIAHAIDPYSRSARSVTDAVLAKIPWASQTLYPNRDIWGEPLPSRTALGGAGISAIYESKMSTDPVNKALWAAQIWPSKIQRRVQGVKLSEQQYDDYARWAGRMAKERLSVLVASPQFSAIPHGLQERALTVALTASRQVAGQMVMMKYPQVAVDARNLKVAKRQ